MKTLLQLLLAALLTVQAFPKTVGFPEDDITVAITKAREHLKAEKIDFDGFFIQKVEFKNQYEELVPQYWEITLVKVPRVKGGYIFVQVFNDGTVKHTFGE
jgi:hypothetical protein